MLKSEQLLIDRIAKGSMDIKTFLQPKEIELYHFNFTGTADQKFLTKLAKLVEQENKNGPKTTQSGQK